MNPPPPDPSPAGGETVGFSTADAKRVGAATKYVEQAIRLGVPVGRGPRGGLTASVIAVTTSSVGGRSSGTYGTGNIQFQRDTGSALVDDTDRPVVQVKNLLNKIIASGSYVVVVYSLGSWWVVAVGDCANLS